MNVTDVMTPPELLSPKARRGKWTVEEEQFVGRIVEDFNLGILDVPQGTTLRNFLSSVLNCDPMRITKKYTGKTFCDIILLCILISLRATFLFLVK